MWSGIGLEFSWCFKKQQGLQAKLCPVLCKCRCLQCNLGGRAEIRRAVPWMWVWVGFQGDQAHLGFLAVLLFLPVVRCPCTVTDCLEQVLKVGWGWSLTVESGQPWKSFLFTPFCHVHCVCRCCLCITRTFLFFREGSRSWNHLLATAKSCSACWVSCTGDSGMNKGVLVDAWEEEMSVQKLLRRLQEMTKWRDRKVTVGKIPVSMDVSLSCQLLQLRNSLWELWILFFFSKKKYLSFSKWLEIPYRKLPIFFFFFFVLYTPVVCVGKHIQVFLLVCLFFFCLQLVCSVFCDGALVVVSLLSSL